MENRIKEIMASVFKLDISEINENTSSYNISNWDSVNHMNLIIALEEEFKTSFELEDIPFMINFKIIREILKNTGKN